MNKKNIMRLTLFGVLILLVFIFYYFELQMYLTLESINAYKQALKNLVEQNYLASLMIFSLAYIGITVIPNPSASLLSLVGGFLFGTWVGCIVNVFSAATGATLSFLVTRYVIGSIIQRRYAQQLHSFNKELNENGLYYLLMLRLMPLFPFFLINMLCGLTRVSIRTFIITTTVGIIPGAFIYSYTGSQLAHVHSPKDILSWQFMLALSLLALLALVPIVIKKLSTHSNANSN